MATPDPFQTFKVEAQELVIELEASLLELEERPTDQELVDRTFRALHTLKGSGAMFGPAPLASFAHEIETSFERIRTREHPATPLLISHFLRATDEFRRLLDTGTTDQVRESSVIDALAAGLGLEAWAAPADPSAAALHGDDPPALVQHWRILLYLPEHALVFGTNPRILLEELRALGRCKVVALTQTIPKLDVLDPTRCLTGFQIDLVGPCLRQQIDDVFIFVADDAQLEIVEVNEAIIAAPVNAAVVPMDVAAPALQEATAQRDSKAAPASVRVPAARLDALMDQVGELVISQARLTQLAHGRDDPALATLAEDIERLAGELRDLTMGMRMLPVSHLFGRFRRVVRDLSQELGKVVELDTAGEDTELDKTVIEALADPLVHLIRNSVDHGIEPASVRQENGKNQQGRILLSARQAGTEVHIAITDDGAGLDRNRIRAKAIRNGLIAEGQFITDREADQLIFHAGFSTAASVTNVSGRGVGMDVVKRTIEELRGTIDVASVQGKGMTITLKLPLTLAIIDGLLVRVGTGIFVVPLAMVHECVELAVTQSPGSTRRSFLNVRGELVPFIRLNESLGCPLQQVDHEMVVIVGAETGRVGLVVDQVIGHHQTVIKTLSPLHRHVESLAGATIMGDGTVALILDVSSLVRTVEARNDEPICA